ncbi:MAG: (2Fe-2S) ferredoxin domain-containing protein [Flavobacteriales bacterium]|nr:(2Fe-2S) ferredoxin domain-containing protein [Flavobacteriales bacterium]NQX96546.1 (2Fe-2S) ferredoxin domain-containing protein [Flavobacteriales bacterium]
MKFEKHIFICINERVAGATRKSCGEETGNAIAKRFKELIKEHKLRLSVRAQRSSCFDMCEQGPIVVVYPEGVFYKGISVIDVNEIFEQHILNNNPVKRLQLTFPNK